MKERLLQEWPKEGELAKLAPPYAAQLAFIVSGKFMDASKVLFEYDREMGHLNPGTCCTLHLVIRKATNVRHKTKGGGEQRPQCCCMQ